MHILWSVLLHAGSQSHTCLPGHAIGVSFQYLSLRIGMSSVYASCGYYSLLQKQVSKEVQMELRGASSPG